jgi:uncharacterized membrane protein
VAQVVETVDVDVPVRTAYDQWTQFETFPQFMAGVESITQVTPTRNHWVTKVSGVRREFDTEITEQHPDERIAWRSTDGESHAGVVTFHRVEDAVTRINVQIDWKPKDLLEKVGSVLQVDDIQVGNDLKRFKELIESQGVEDGAWRGDVGRAPDATGR